MHSGNRIGVVTVTYNSGTVLSPFLQCTFSQTHQDFLLFAVDNASTDDTREQLDACEDPRLRVILNETNLGVAEGNNQGMRAAVENGCDYILLLNNDVEYAPSMYNELLVGLLDSKADMVCPKMLFYEPPNVIWAAGGELQPHLGYRSRHLRLMDLDDDDKEVPIQISYVPTCCLLIHRSVIDRIGMMDPLYFVYVDDVDFMYRAHVAGIKLMYLPHPRLRHKVGGLTGGKESPFTIRFCTRNRVYYLLKHFGRVRSLPWILLYAAYFWYGLILRGDSWTDFKIRQRSFLEGFGVYREYLKTSEREIRKNA